MKKDFATKLAYRAYMYSLLHVVFGQRLDEEALQGLASGMTIDCLEYLAAESSAPSTYLDCARMLEKTLQEDEQKTIEELSSSYTKLFLVPGDAYVHPWESPYRGKEGLIFQESTLDVRYRYQEYGFEAVGYKHFPEDHVAMMCHFLAALSQQAYEACEADEPEQVRGVLQSQRAFLEEHFGGWQKLFAEKLALHDDFGFFLVFARVLSAFIEDDLRFLNQTVL